MNKLNVGFAICGSFCTFDKIIEEKDIDISSSNVYTRYYYVLKFNDEEIITYNSNLINEFESMFK